MNTSIDDQASQSTTTDQQSETSSSANAQSPSRSVASSSAQPSHQQYNLMNVAGPGSHFSPSNPTNQQQHQQQQQQHHHNHHIGYQQQASNNYLSGQQETYVCPHSSSGYNQHPDTKHQHHHSQQQHNSKSTLPVLASSPHFHKRIYTGVDKLIMAAMLDESAAAAAAAVASAAANATGVSGGASYMGPSGRGIGYLGDSARDANNYAQIPTPSNKSELELYRLLDRANLLNYFGTFLNFGGDDVQQLSDADEDEFLEIMSLVGMTQKPLHVRRLQKALIEWREGDNSLERQSNFATTTSNNFRPRQQQQQPPPHQHSVAHRGQQLNCREEMDNLNQQHCHHQKSQRQQALPVVELGAPIQASTPTRRPASHDMLENRSQQYYALPHELNGAPKRLRLMDNLHKKAQNGDQQCPIAAGAQTRDLGPSSNDRLAFDVDDELSCHDESGARSDDDKIIEIVDSPRESSIDGLDLDEDEANEQPKCESPKSSILSHSKFARYRSMLLESHGKVRSNQ